MVHATSPHPSGLPTRMPCMQTCQLGSHACMPCKQSKWSNPQRIRVWHVDFTWIHGPTKASKPHQNRVDTGNRPKDPHGSHQKKARAWGPTRGSADPTGRSNRPWLGLSCASTWWLSIGPKRHPRGVCLHSSSMHRPINRRRGGSLMRYSQLQHLSHF
jgi:hypothetical protein